MCVEWLVSTRLYNHFRKKAPRRTLKIDTSAVEFVHFGVRSFYEIYGFILWRFLFKFFFNHGFSVHHFFFLFLFTSRIILVALFFNFLLLLLFRAPFLCQWFYLLGATLGSRELSLSFSISSLHQLNPPTKSG